jgi:hypothetical protein
MGLVPGSPERLTEPQEAFLGSGAGDVLLGGEAYGGKSYMLREDALRRCCLWPGYKAAIFRRHYKELEEKFFPWMRELDEVMGEWFEGRYTYEFENGSRLIFHHAEHTEDVHRFKGADFHYLGIDEITEFEPYQLEYLIGRSVRGPAKYPRRIRATSNPDGPAHEWVKARYISPVQQVEPHIHRTYNEDGSRAPEWDYECVFGHDEWQPVENGVKVLSRQFIRASWRDNWFTNREEYFGQLSQLPEPARSAQRDGNWDFSSEMALSEFGDRHVCAPFELDPGWPVSVGVDQGFYPDPWAAHFVAHDFSVRHPLIRELHRIYVFGEFHRHRVILDDQAQMIAERLLENGVADATIYLPHDMRSPSAAKFGYIESDEKVYRRVLQPYGHRVRMAPTGPGFREQTLTRWRQYLSDAPDGKPWLRIMDGRAPSLARTLPTLKLDPNNPKVIRERGQDDHDYDGVSKVLMAVRAAPMGANGRMNPLEVAWR